MSYFGEHYPFYVPPYISGTEKVKMSTTKVTNMTEMEQRIKMRYAFAMSSFGRMFRPNNIVYEMRVLCKEWSENIDKVPPGKDLYQVDRYFLELWKNKTNDCED
jgi:HKD family nuclease